MIQDVYKRQVRVLETLAKALSGAFGADWRCEKRRTNAPALSVGGWYAAGGAVLLRNRKHIRPPIRAEPAGTHFPNPKPINHNKLFFKIRRNILWISLTLL